MSSVKWTKEQTEAIIKKGSNILVSAAAGSGKTAVLVERIITKIVEEKIDIDKLLVVTFTNAAASEMRARVLDAIYKRLEETPNDTHLQKQVTLLNKSNICTIHSFCLDVIKNNFYEIDVSPNFRIGDTSEIELLKQDVLEELFEEKYINDDEQFLKLIHIYTGYRGDEPLKELILNIYEYIQSSPFPEEWLNEKINAFGIKKKEKEDEIKGKDFANTIWGKLLLNNFAEELEDCIQTLKNMKNELEREQELLKYVQIIDHDITQLENLMRNLDCWDKAYCISGDIKFDIWKVDKKVTLELKDKAKEIRDKVKKQFHTKREKIFLYDSQKAKEDLYEMYQILKPLETLLLEFMVCFGNKKKEKNIVDFHDIEHYALKILVTKNEKEQDVPTSTAKKYQNKFIEIAIDEYQDSNLVQEYILTAISKGNNIFMVGDVKQSIYKFRQARPELFLEKYNTYKLEKDKKEQHHLKIQLFKNFRSRKNIIDITNLVFQDLMSEQIGDIEYNQEEYLNLGAEYEQIENKKALRKIRIAYYRLKTRGARRYARARRNRWNRRCTFRSKICGWKDKANGRGEGSGI